MVTLFIEIIIGALAAIAVVVFLIVYNSLVEVKNNVSRAWANIDVLLEKRHDLIGKLVDTVKGYEAYEKTVLVKITSLRTAWSQVQNSSVEDKMGTSNQISTALKSIFAVSENYPDLKADQVFLELQKALEDIENQIADRREFYNDSVNQYNIRTQTIPYNAFAKMLGYKAMSFFKAPAGAEEPVNANV